MDNQQGSTVLCRELCSLFHGSLDGRGVWRRMDTCICMAEFLSTWNYHNIVNWLCAVLCLVVQSCLTLWDPMDFSLPGSPVCGISQARILEWVVKPSSRESSQPRYQTQVYHIAGGLFTIWATIGYTLNQIKCLKKFFLIKLKKKSSYSLQMNFKEYLTK